MTARSADKHPPEETSPALARTPSRRTSTTTTAVLEPAGETVETAGAVLPVQAAAADARIEPLQTPAGAVPQQYMPAQQPMYPAHVNVQVSAPAAPQIVIQVKQRGLFVRALYFLFVGCWLSGWAILAAGVCIASIVLMPAGLAIVNRLPQIMTLRPRSTEVNAALLADGSMQYTVGNAEQRSLAVRAVYFCLVGWWAGMFAMTAAWVLCVLIVTMPLGLMIINRAPAVFTLRRN